MTVLVLAGVLSAAGAASADDTGTLSVTTTPWTKVTVDGESVGNTPVVHHKLDKGKHKVTLVNESMEIKVSMTVKIVDGEETKIAHSFEMETDAGKGTLSVATTPWTKVYVDGKEIGNTPLTNYRLKPGNHTIKLVNKGLGVSETLTVTIKEGAETRINKKLVSKPDTGTLSINAHPWAKVYINGVDMGNTPIIKHKIEPGKHKVKLVNDALGISETFTVKVDKGEDTKISKDLSGKASKGETGTLSVTATPWAVVYIDGKKVGNTPLIKHKLSPGKHKVKPVNEDLGVEKTWTVKILKGEETKLVKKLD
jgi:hypothetical protein